MDYATAASSSTVHQASLIPNFSIPESEITPSASNLTSKSAQMGLPPRTLLSNKSRQDTDLPYSPKRKNAILLENTQEFSQDQCLRVVADVVGGHNIHYCSRLSAGRMCMYLTDHTHVENICNEGGVLIGSVFIPCRRYVTDSTKFIISNCPPELQDDDLKKLLEPYGKVTSAPTRLKVSTVHEDLKHIKSWRRSVYVLIPTGAPEMPKRLFVKGPDNTNFTLYIERDEIVCSFCLAPGHTAEKCHRRKNHEQLFPEFAPPVSHRLFVNRQTPSIPATHSSEPPNTFMPSFSGNASFSTPEKSAQLQASQETPTDLITLDFEQERPPNPSSQDLTGTRNPDNPSIVPAYTDSVDSNSWLDDSMQIEINKNDNKRKNLSTDEDESIRSDTGMFSDTSSASSSTTTSKKAKKKAKTKDKEQIALCEVINQMKFKENYLSKENFTAFMKDARGKQNSRNIAARFTDNFGSLIVQLHEAENLCMDFNLKRRFQRAAEALTNHEGET